MIFKTLKDKCEYYRSLTDYRLMPNGYILVMLDGKNFSSLIKNKFEKPFDEWFIHTMNETAKCLCKNLQNIVGAYVQSDEISLVIKDNSLTCMPFDGRMCKLLSIIPGFADSIFLKRIISRFIGEFHSKEEISAFLENMPDYIFDCKVWTVPNENDAMAWFLYRQIDCIRNSKQQFCQTYLSHNSLHKKHTDEQVELCLKETGKDWNSISDDKKYGRLIYKTQVEMETPEGQPYTRSKWEIISSNLIDKNFREYITKQWFNDKEKEESYEVQ